MRVCEGGGGLVLCEGGKKGGKMFTVVGWAEMRRVDCSRKAWAVGR